MPKILSFKGDSNLEKENLFKDLWQKFQELDKPLKIMVVSFLLIAFSTPAIVLNYQVFKSRAQTDIPEATTNPNGEQENIEFVSNEILIKVKKEVKSVVRSNKDNTGLSSLDNKLKVHNANSFKKIVNEGKTRNRDAEVYQWYKVELNREDKKLKAKLNNANNEIIPENVDTQEFLAILEEFKNDPNIEYAEPNFIVRISQAPSPIFTPTMTPTIAPSPISTPTPTITPTSPTTTPTNPGFTIEPSIVDVTIPNNVVGNEVKAFDFTSTGATGFNFVGNPTNAGDAINWIPYSGGITPGSTIQIKMKIYKSVPNGTYTGTAILHGLPSGQVAIPVTVRLGSSTPTPFPTSIPGPDPDFEKLWGLHNVGQTGGLAGADINAPEAWEITRGSQNIVVGVIDTGIDYTHPDLSQNMWINSAEIPNNNIDEDRNGYIDDYFGCNFIYIIEFDCGNPMDDQSHGTHVAGTIGAVEENSIGIIGVAPNVKLMALKFLDSNGYGYTSDAINAVNYAAIMGVKITNNSWGGGGYSQALYDAIKFANDSGSIFVAAAGNFNSNNDKSPFYPSSYNLPNVISVAATDHNDQRAFFSNYGTSVDIAAPGVNIYSTIPGGKFAYFNGTSMAAPHATGVIALILMHRPTFTNEEIKYVLRSSADDVGNVGFDIDLGYGRIRADRALQINSACISRIDSPNSNAVFSSGIDIVITGSASCTAFQSYKLEHATALGSSWNLIQTNIVPVKNGTLGIWNIPASGIHYIRLTTMNIEGNIFEEIISILIIDSSDFHRGWPVTINSGLVHAVTADLDNDGIKEIIVGTYDGYLHVFREDGTYFSNAWPKKLGGSVTSPAIGDLNNDGFLEIVIAERYDFGSYFPNGRVHVLRPDGTYLPGWPYILNGGVDDSNNVSLIDFDNDEDMEVFIGTGTSNGNIDGSITYFQKVYGLEHTGELIQGWPIEVGQQEGDQPRSIVFADLDSDERIEIIIGFMRWLPPAPSSGGVDAFHSDGSRVTGFPFYMPGWGYNIAAGDLNGDGTTEIIASNQQLNSQGKPVLAWNKPSYVISQWALADIDHNGTIEMAYGQGGNNVSLLDWKGNSLPGWPITTSDTHDIMDGNPIIADIDGDGSTEILIGSLNSNNLYAWHEDGTIVSGFPKITQGLHRNIMVDDIDADGLLELISASYESGKGKIYIWDLKGSAQTGSSQWPQFKHDSQRTGFYPNPRPDLVIEDIYQGGKEPGTSSDYVYARYKNIGASASGEFLIKLNTPEASPAAGLGFPVPPPNVSMRTRGISINSLKLSPGETQTITAEIDNKKSVRESNEKNNKFSKTVTIILPTVIVTEPIEGSTVSSSGFRFAGTAQANPSNIASVTEVRVRVFDVSRGTLTVANARANYNPTNKQWGFNVLPGTITPGSKAELRVRAKDNLGNWSPWSKKIIVNISP